jgi:hypothetical protein
LSYDHTQEALDEYYSTGEDPTGGDIEQDDYIVEKEALDDVEPQNLMDGLDRLEELIDEKLAQLDIITSNKTGK